ncbi:MAG TPA: 2-oxoglutarate and iron-dependent oxygenase domain-containing protein [Leptolyngbyaceae cyanobacterium]
MPPPASQSIPCLDLQDFLGPNQELRSHFIHALGTALEDIGFFVLKNTGISTADIRSAYEAADHFFALPNAVKQRYEYPHLKGQGGFTQFGREQAKNAAVADLKEFWHVHRHSLELPVSFWPQEAPEFQQVMIQLYHHLENCANTLLEACALYLDQPQTWLRDMVSGGNTVLRVAHYPPIPPTCPLAVYGQLPTKTSTSSPCSAKRRLLGWKF